MKIFSLSAILGLSSLGLSPSAFSAETSKVTESLKLVVCGLAIDRRASDVSPEELSTLNFKIEKTLKDNVGSTMGGVQLNEGEVCVIINKAKPEPKMGDPNFDFKSYIDDAASLGQSMGAGH